MRWGDEEVPVESRSWRAATDVVGYRKTYRLRPGELWSDAPVTEGQYEHLVDTESGPLPVGVTIARELVESGADWAVMVELWGRIVLVDHHGQCVPIDGPAGGLLTAMRAANGDRWGGFADVVGARGDTILLREAKVAGKRDRLRANQHEFMCAMRLCFGERVDAAIVEWDGTNARGVTDPAFGDTLVSRTIEVCVELHVGGHRKRGRLRAGRGQGSHRAQRARGYADSPVSES